MTTDEQAIRETHTTWIAAVNAGDLDCLLTMMADDLVCLHPGREPFGRDGLVAGFRAGHQQAVIDCASDLEEVVVVGDLAYTRCRDTVTATPRAGGEAAKFAGHRITIYRRHPEGYWLLARDANTMTPVTG